MAAVLLSVVILGSVSVSRGIQKVTLRALDLTQIPESIIPDNVTNLRLDNNLLVHLPDFAFSDYSQLVFLRLTGNKITNISADAFTNNILDLRRNQIGIIVADDFSGLLALSDLRLCGNNLM
jgi:Leucine-rich repeat (LRR) protein